MNTQSTVRKSSDAHTRSLWRLVRLVYLWRYGVRGGIKPPINWNRANSLAYRWRYRMWKIEDAIYRRTGIPDEWGSSDAGEVMYRTIHPDGC